MVKGSQSKEIVTKKILELFPGSFQYEKEIRVPMIENGEMIQLKVTLTCAKTNVEKDGENMLPGENVETPSNEKIDFNNKEIAQPSQQEIDTLSRLAKMLNL